MPFPRFTAALLLASSGVAFLFAPGCGSDDDKKTERGGDAGAAGSDEGGAPSSGGSSDGPAGAPSEASAGQAGAGVAGDGGAGGGGSDGSAGAGTTNEAGAPSTSECLTKGTASGVALLTEPTYQGCRGSLVHIGFDVETSDDTFACCGLSTSAPPFEKSMQAISNQDGGGDVLLAVPSDSPLGSYTVNVTCPGQAAPEGIAVEINDAPPPIVASVTNEIFPNGTLTIAGQNLDTVTQISAFNPGSGNTAFCNIDAENTTATSLSCSFAAIPPTAEGEAYILDVSNDTCGSAINRPTFIVNPLTL